MRSLVLSLVCIGAACASDIDSRVTHGYADSNGVKIHYASLGQGPLIVMIHGFPDFWYTWRYQMEALSDKFQCVAIDQRGYNLSDKPKGVENYDMRLLVGDVAAVIKSLGKDKAIIVGHDWGGAVAWQFALNLPQMTDRLIILNLPHPRGLAHSLATNPEQQKNSAYARAFQQPDAASKITPDILVNQFLRIKDPEVKAKYLAAFQRSDIEAMLNYYKRNYPREPYTEDPSAPVVKTQMSVLMSHGLGDTALLSGALNNTWDWMGKDLTLVTIPGAGHFVQTDPESADLVSRSMRAWLLR
jgi:pimeloyl-ACP methyl ester carboxylesterase